MRLALAISAIYGASVIVSLGALVMVQKLSQMVQKLSQPSPSWNRKRIAWILLICCELLALTDRIINGAEGRWIGLLFSVLFLAAMCGMLDSYRIMLADLTLLYNRLSKRK